MTAPKSVPAASPVVGHSAGVSASPRAETPAANAPVEAPEVGHVVCCEDDNVVLCGLDATDMPFGDVDFPCVVCADLELTPFCPKGGRCPL